MRILGLSAYYHDSAAALIEDGRILAAAQEERFTRVKHDARFPHHAVAYCLAHAPGPIDAVVYYEKPLLKFDRILRTFFAVAPRGFRAFTAAIPDWLHHKLWVPLEIEKALARHGLSADDKIHFVPHHESHAASAFFPSPFSRAAVLTLDGVGEWATTSLAHGDGNQINTLRELRFPDSLGLLYSAFTHYCGFRVNSGEYKLMGLAPYGEPRFAHLITEKLLTLRADGSFRLNLDTFGFLHGDAMTNARFEALFGGPRRAPDTSPTQRDCDLARSIQVVTEEIVLRIARHLHELTGETNLCLAGGVALNCVANGRLLREGPFKNIWVQPAAGDAGGALGAALSYYYQHLRSPRVTDDHHDAMQAAALGPAYTDAEIAATLAEHAIPLPPALPPAELHSAVTRLLTTEKVVGYFAGRAEFGPRALGNRSILADARSPRMQSVLNLKIKQRESFRPFAPIVLAEHAADYFELTGPSPYMLFTAPVRAGRRLPIPPTATTLQEKLHSPRSDIPAVTHVDYSARVQTVSAPERPDLHALLSTFHAATGCPVLINTSFNVRGEPPVCHPRDALACFLDTEMDALALGPYLLEKQNLPPSLLRARPARTFAPD